MTGQEPGLSAAPSAPVKETSAATFRADVLTESARQPVMVEFWSPRDAQGAKFSPLLQKIAAKAAGRLVLVRMNVDETPQIASQLGLQSVPSIVVFQRGQPVDGFSGPLPEAQLRGFVERIAGPLDADVAAILAEAETLAESGGLEQAAEFYQQIMAQEPGHPKAVAGLAKLALASGDAATAAELLDALPDEASKDPAVSAARAAIDLALQASDLGDLEPLRQKVAANPADHQSRFELALALAGAGQREEAADALLEIIRKDRKWNEEAARKQLLQFFEAWGPMDPDTIAARRKLSGLLFA